MSSAGVLLLGVQQGYFKLKYPFLKYALKQVDNKLLEFANFISNKDRLQIRRMIKNMKENNSNDEFENILITYFLIDWCIDNAFGSDKYKQTRTALKMARSRLLGYLKRLKDSYTKEQIMEYLANFYMEVEL